MASTDPNSMFFKTAVHQCNDLVVITDHDAKIIYVNPAFELHTGYFLKNIKGKNISIVKSGQHNNAFYKSLWKSLKQGSPRSTVFINMKRNGELYYENKTITPILDAKGRIEYYLSTSKDVTAELLLQKQVTRQNNFINSVLQNTEALIIGLDIAGKIILFNKACEKLTGYKFAELKDKYIFDTLIPHEERAKIKRVFSGAKSTKKTHKYGENYWLTKNKRKVLISWSNSAIQDDTRTTKVVLSTGKDITKERRTETELKDLNIFLDEKVKQRTSELNKLNEEVILKNKFITKINSEIPAIVYLIDLEKKKIILFNNRFNKNIVAPFEKNKEISLRKFLRFIDSKNKKETEDRFLKPNPKGFEIPFNFAGAQYWFQNKSTSFERKSGIVTKVLGFITDITDTKFVENKLIESQSLAKLGNWEWNIFTNELYWSREIYRIFDVDYEKFAPSYQKFLDSIHPEDRDSVIKAVDDSIKSHMPYEVVHRHVNKKGETTFVREKGYTVYSKGGKPLRMIGTAQDITQEKLLKEKLNSAYVTLQNSLNAVFTSDLNGKVLFANNTAVKMWGFSSLEEMLSNKPSVFDYWAHEYNEKMLSIIEALLVSGFFYSEEPFIGLKKSGEGIFVKFNISTIKNEKGEPIGITGDFFDVTRQLQIERRMKEYDQKIEQLFGNIEEVVFGIDITEGGLLEGMPFYLSSRSKEIMGFDLEELKANPRLWSQLLHPDDHENIQLTSKECIETRSTVTRTYRLKHKIIGQYFWFEEKITPNYDANGKLIALFGSARDITARIENESKLKESEEKYRLLSDNNQDLISLRDINAKPIFISNSVTSLLGYTVEEYLQLNLFDLIHPDDRASVKKESFLTNVTKQERGFIEGRIRHKSGHYIWLQTLTKLVYDEHGKVVRIVGSSRNITERKKLEEAIFASEQKYRSIFENSLAAIFRTNIFTQEVSEANEVCVQLFGYDSKEDFIQNFKSSKSYFNVSERDILFKGLASGKTILNQRLRFVRKDGSVFWSDVSAKFLNQEGDIEGVFMDVTKTVEYEAQLQKNIKEKEYLLKEVHHRVKNNLQIISSLLKLQLDKIYDPVLRQPLIESHERIRAIALIHEKLYLSQDLSTIDFADYLSNLSSSLRFLTSSKQINLKYDLQPYFTDINLAIPLGLLCYEVISNIFKHAFINKKGGDLSISVSNTESANVCISISDNGDGFDPEEANAKKTLGLKLVKNLAAQANATIEYSSLIGEGSVFKIQL